MFYFARSFALVLLVGICLVFFGPGVVPVLAQDPDPLVADVSDNYCDPFTPCDPSIPPARRYQLAGPNAARMDPAVVREAAPVPERTGGPDAFGYTWTVVPYQWVDMGSFGQDLEFHGASYNKRSGPLWLPFSFPFYENHYSEIYVGAMGFVTFGSPGTLPNQGLVPSPYTPNNLIAPYWAPFYFTGVGKGNVIFNVGGTAPNRYAVIIWNKVKGGASTDTVGSDDTYTFQVVLYEDGSILFVYGNMNVNGSYYCGTAGIEDAGGFTGLTTHKYCSPPTSHKAIKFSRPTPTARVEVTPNPNDGFSPPGSTASYTFQIRNTGDLGADTFKVSPAKMGSYYWDIGLYAADGVTPITQVGPLEVNESATAVVKVQVPNDAPVGAQDQAALFVTSGLNSSVSTEIPIHTAVVSDFAVAYHTYDNHAATLDLVRNSTHSLVNVTGDDYYATYPGVVRHSDGNYLYAWDKTRCMNARCRLVAQELEFAMLPADASTVSTIRKVAPLGTRKKSTYQYSYGMATGDDTNATAVVWIQEEDDTNGTWNQNVWFTVLDSSGNTFIVPRQLTKNKLWGNSTTDGVPFYSHARVTFTQDHRWVVVWEREIRKNGKWVSDIYYEILSINGVVMRSPKKFTAGSASEGYYSPDVLTLKDGRILLAFARLSPKSQSMYIGTLTSVGNVTMVPTPITQDYSPFYEDLSSPEIVQHNDGRIILAWNCYVGNAWRVSYLPLDTTLTPPAGMTTFDLLSRFGYGPASMTALDDGSTVLTWHDYSSLYRHNLYYALVNSYNNVGQYLIMQRSDTYITSSFSGLGNSK